jgi:hypothetical protein
MHIIGRDCHHGGMCLMKRVRSKGDQNEPDKGNKTHSNSQTGKLLAKMCVH